MALKSMVAVVYIESNPLHWYPVRFDVTLGAPCAPQVPLDSATHNVWASQEIDTDNVADGTPITAEPLCDVSVGGVCHLSEASETSGEDVSGSRSHLSHCRPGVRVGSEGKKSMTVLLKSVESFWLDIRRDWLTFLICYKHHLYIVSARCLLIEQVVSWSSLVPDQVVWTILSKISLHKLFNQSASSNQHTC